jgi:hypothetical protein
VSDRKPIPLESVLNWRPADRERVEEAIEAKASAMAEERITAAQTRVEARRWAIEQVIAAGFATSGVALVDAADRLLLWVHRP